MFEGVKTSVAKAKKERVLSISGPRESSVRENHKPWVQHNLLVKRKNEMTSQKPSDKSTNREQDMT